MIILQFAEHLEKSVQALMKYRKRRKKPPVKITREDIEKAMLEYEGETAYLKVETEKTDSNNPAKTPALSSPAFQKTIKESSKSLFFFSPAEILLPYNP